jgi:hypothetical protein
LVRGILLKRLSFEVLDKNYATNAYSIEIKLRDGQTALRLLTLLHEKTLSVIRERERAQSEAIIAALHTLYDKTQVQDYRLSLARMIADQEMKNLLLQNPSYPVTVEVVDPPTIITPLHRSAILWIIGGGLVGVGAAGVLVCILFFLSMRGNAASPKRDPRLEQRFSVQSSHLDVQD